MTRFLLILVLPVLAMVYLGSCSEDVDFGPSIYDTSTPYLSDVDKWIRENYIGPHNIEVIYKWSDIEAETDKNLTPPRADTVVPFLRVVKKAWLDTYITLCGKDVMNPIFPKQLLLLGSNAYNTDGTVTQGTAEGGKKIVLYNLDEFDPVVPHLLTVFKNCCKIPLVSRNLAQQVPLLIDRLYSTQTEVSIKEIIADILARLAEDANTPLAECLFLISAETDVSEPALERMRYRAPRRHVGISR